MKVYMTPMPLSLPSDIRSPSIINLHTDLHCVSHAYAYDQLSYSETEVVNAFPHKFIPFLGLLLHDPWTFL